MMPHQMSTVLQLTKPTKKGRQIMQPLEKPIAKRKFSQSCNSKQDFLDLLIELRDKAEKKQYDPENTFSREYQKGFGDGEWSVLDSLVYELVKSPDSRTY